MKIVDYIDNKNITVEFLDDHHCRVHTNYPSFVKGGVKNPYDKTVCGVGYLGEGQYGAGQKDRNVYLAWMDILRRCFHPSERQAGYVGCSVVEEWHNFQNFAKWYYENSYNSFDEKLQVDKDLLYFNNKIYGPDTCLLIPERINYLIVRQWTRRGRYPIGVRKEPGCARFEARCMTDKGKETLGFFSTPEEAFIAYKKRKEEFIKEVANNYKDIIPSKVYKALLNYKVVDDTKLIA